MDLRRFGQELRELREGRGITQEEIIDRTKAYKDARTLRKIEAGLMQPRRAAVIGLIVEGLGESDAAVVNRFLELAGYTSLQDIEIVRLGIVEPQIIEPDGPAIKLEPISASIRKLWWVLIAVCVPSGLVLSVAVRSPFFVITSILYGGLYAGSVLLESAYQFRGRDTDLAALVAFGVTWPTGLVALWTDTSLAGEPGLWVAFAIIIVAGVGQSLAVQSALAPYRIVPLDYQSHTARAAHFKNSVYFFLLFAFPFWILPAHCANRMAPAASSLCPHPMILGVLLALYVCVALIMGRDLLPRLAHHKNNNRYQMLVYVRAILYFGLCLVCTAHYAASRQ